MSPSKSLKKRWIWLNCSPKTGARRLLVGLDIVEDKLMEIWAVRFACQFSNDTTSINTTNANPIPAITPDSFAYENGDVPIT